MPEMRVEDQGDRGMTGSAGGPFRPVIVVMFALILCGAIVASIGGIWMLLAGRFGDNLVDVVASAVFGVALGGTALAAMYALERGRLPILMWCGMAASAGAYVLWLPHIWWGFAPADVGAGWITYMAATLTVVAVVAAHSGLLGVLRTQSSILHALRVVGLGVAWFWGVWVVLLVWCGQWLVETRESVLMVLVGAAALTGAALLLGGVVLGAAMRAEERRRKRKRETMPGRIRLTMTCPRCREEQTFGMGAARCARCGFRMLIEVEEPRCECGYLLYRLEGEVCPECGRSVPPELRWSR